MNYILATFIAIFTLFTSGKVVGQEIAKGSIGSLHITINRFLDNNIFISNPDGMRFFKTQLDARIKDGDKIIESKGIESDIYTQADIGIVPSYYDPSSGKIIVFVLGKSKRESNYGMNGYSYTIDTKTLEFTRDAVFSDANYGWFSYFGHANNGVPRLWHFSYDGYRSMYSDRRSDGGWVTKDNGAMQPSEASSIRNKQKLFFVFDPAKSKQTRVHAGDWIADQKGCKAFNKNPVPGETITWSGQCKDGYATGNGVQQWFVNGKPTDRYKGAMLNGRYHGKGTHTWSASGGRYEGDWINGERTGKGIYVWLNGERYDGEFVNGALHGKGKKTWNESNRNCGSILCFKSFVGEYKNNNMSCGHTVFWNGDSYDGCYNEKGEITGDTKYQIAENNKRFERISRCQHLYQGRVFKRENFFGHLNYIVIGFSPSHGRATVKAEHDGSMSEISCTDIPE